MNQFHVLMSFMALALSLYLFSTAVGANDFTAALNDAVKRIDTEDNQAQMVLNWSAAGVFSLCTLFMLGNLIANKGNGVVSDGSGGSGFRSMSMAGGVRGFEPM